MRDSFQTVTLVLGDGRRVTYIGRPQIDQINPPKVVEILVSRSWQLPEGLTWDMMPKPQEPEGKCR